MIGIIIVTGVTYNVGKTRGLLKIREGFLPKYYIG